MPYGDGPFVSIAWVFCAEGADEDDGIGTVGCDVALAGDSEGDGGSGRGCEGSALGGMTDRLFSWWPRVADGAVG